MYKIYDDPPRMTYDDIFKKYLGKWVYIIQEEGPFFEKDPLGNMVPCRPTHARILVEADKPFEGEETGIYEDIKNHPEKYGPSGELYLISHVKLNFSKSGDVNV